MHTKPFLIAITFLWTVLVLHAQDRSTSIALSKTEYSSRTYAVEGAGALIVHKLTKDNNDSEEKGLFPGVKLYRINTQGEKIWEVYTGRQNVMESFGIAYSSKMEYVFYVSGSYKKMTVTQLDPQGKIKKLELKDLFGFNVGHAMFGTTKHFCLITRKHEYIDKVGKDVFTLHTWENESSASNKYTLALPDLDKKEKFGRWFYYGNTHESIYFISKYSEHNKVSLRLLALGFDGKLQSDKKIELGLNANLELSGSGSAQKMEGSIFMDSSLEDIYSLSSVHIDCANNALYSWSIGDWEDQKKPRAGFYLNKFNLNGQLEWTTQDEIPESIIKNGFTKMLRKQGMATVLKVNYDQTITMHILVLGAIHTMEFFPHGDLRSIFSNTDISTVGLGEAIFHFEGSDESPALQFMQKKVQTEADNKAFMKGTSYFFRFSDGELITEMPKNSASLNLYWFKRN